MEEDDAWWDAVMAEEDLWDLYQEWDWLNWEEDDE